MGSRYADRVVIVTGGSSGIGEGCAREFVRAGSRVLLCSNDAGRGRAVERDLRELARARGAGEALFAYCDVTKEEEVRRLVEGAVGRFGRLDCLVNNAGWHPPHRPIDDFPAGEFRSLLELNLVSVFVACQAALPHLRRARGNVINMSSLVGRIGQRHATTYAATKGAVTAFTKALALDEAASGVRVNSVSPGNILTPLWQEAAAATPDPERALAEGRAAQPVGRMGTAEEVGRLCVFIAAEATFTTGVDHVISGGAELGYARKSGKADAS